jgi:hypothetical protein
MLKLPQSPVTASPVSSSGKLLGKSLSCHFPNPSTWQTSCLPCFLLAFQSEPHYSFSGPKTLLVVFPLFPDLAVKLVAIAAPGLDSTETAPFPEVRRAVACSPSQPAQLAIFPGNPRSPIGSDHRGLIAFWIILPPFSQVDEVIGSVFVQYGLAPLRCPC